MQRPEFELYMVHQLIHFKKGEIITLDYLTNKIYKKEIDEFQ
jgi:hypothetical protein